MSSKDTRARIVDAAREELEAGRGLSIKTVALRAGVSRQAVHYHFGGAQGLRSELVSLGVAGASSDVDEPTRERLIAAAIRVLSTPGGGEATLEAIAAEAGLTKGAIYHHFEDRTALLRAVARRVSPVDTVVRAIEGAADLPAREGLVALARAYHQAISDRADLIRNLVANTSRDPGLSAIIFEEVATRGAPVILAWFRRQIDEGSLRAVDATLVVQALFGPAFMPVVLGPWVSTLLERLGATPAIDRLDEYVDLLMAGIGPEDR